MPKSKKATTKKTKTTANTENTSKNITEAEYNEVMRKRASKKKVILGRNDIDKVEKYVKEGKVVHVKGSGEKRKYIVFL